VGTLRARRKTVPLLLSQWQQEEAQGQPQPKRRRGQRGQAAPTTPVVQQFFVGQLVRAQWRTEDGVDPTWYEGTVQAFNAEEGQAWYHVTYEDGEQHEHVLPQHIRAMQ
jgi:hypothetical protein